MALSRCRAWQELTTTKKMENEKMNIKIEGRGKYSAIAEYLYYNNLIPNFEGWVEEQKQNIEQKALEKGYSSEKLFYIIYVEVYEDDGTIWGEMVGYETEQFINSFESYKLFSRYNYVKRKGWHKEHQQNIYRLFQEAELEDLRKQNEELKEKIKKYEYEGDEE